MNNAAIFNKKGVLDMPLDEWRRQLEIILGGAFLFTKHVAKSMIEQNAQGRDHQYHLDRGASGRAE